MSKSRHQDLEKEINLMARISHIALNLEVKKSLYVEVEMEKNLFATP